MSTDFSKPVVTDGYATLLPGIVTALQDLARGLEPTLTGVSTNVPTGAVRWNAGTSLWERYNGSSWPALAATYGISISGSAGTAGTATNLAGGAAGGIPYQTGAGATAQLGAGVAGSVLTSGGAGAPTWTTQAAMTVGTASTANALNTSNAYTVNGITSTGPVVLPGSSTCAIRAGTGDGASATVYNVAIQSWWGIGFRDYQNLNTVQAWIDCRTGTFSGNGGFVGPGTGLTGTASSLTSGAATNLAGGSNGTIPYQSAAGTSQQLAAGTAGQVLQSNGAAAPSWVNSPNVVYSTATTPLNANGVSYVVTHSFGLTPVDCVLEITCLTAEGGYAVGDVITDPSPWNGTTPSQTTIWKNATQCGKPIPAGYQLVILNKSTGVGTTATLANWSWRFRMRKA